MVPSAAIVRCWIPEPLASTQSPTAPSVGILVLDHLASSGLAVADFGVEIIPNKLSNRVNVKAATISHIFAIWRSLSDFINEVNTGGIK